MANGSPDWQDAIRRLREELRQEQIETRRRDREEIDVLTNTILALQRQNTFLWARVSRLQNAEKAHEAISAGVVAEEDNEEVPEGIPGDFEPIP